MRRNRQRGAAMAEFLILMPVMLLMWFGIDYFRSGYARRLEAFGKARAAAWKLAYSNDGSCFANKEFFAGFTGENNAMDPSVVGQKGAEATETFKGNTSSSLFMYAHANVSATMKTNAAYFNNGTVSEVGGGSYVTCNEVVPATSAAAGVGSHGWEEYSDQNVLTPLWDFVKSIF